MKETRKRKRLYGFIIDLIVIGLLMEITFRLEELMTYQSAIRTLRVAIVFGGYHILMEYFLGKTVGKFVFKTRVVNKGGNKISFKEAVIRFVSRLIPFEFASLALGIDARAWHDVLSKTYVIDELKK
jgi:uncharacterized RDD family membrane protein YckC